MSTAILKIHNNFKHYMHGLIGSWLVWQELGRSFKYNLMPTSVLKSFVGIHYTIHSLVIASIYLNVVSCLICDIIFSMFVSSRWDHGSMGLHFPLYLSTLSWSPHIKCWPVCVLHYIGYSQSCVNFHTCLFLYLLMDQCHMFPKGCLILHTKHVR